MVNIHSLILSLLFHCCQQIEELNQEIKINGEDKASVTASLRECRTKLEESELLRERLTNRMDTLFKKIESEEQEKETLLQQADRLNEKVRGSCHENAFLLPCIFPKCRRSNAL